MNGFRDPLSILDELHDILPPPEEILTEIRTTQRTWDRLLLSTEHSGLASFWGEFAGIPVFVDDTVEPGEIWLRFSDGSVKVLGR